MQCFIWLKDPIGIVRCDGLRKAMRKNEIDPAEPLLYSIINAVYSGSPAVSIPIDNFTVNRNCGMLIYIFEEDAFCESRSSHAIRDHD